MNHREKYGSARNMIADDGTKQKITMAHRFATTPFLTRVRTAVRVPGAGKRSVRHTFNAVRKKTTEKTSHTVVDIAATA